MARPRVFISSTYYDLKHIRSSVEVFVHSLGYDSILSEKGDIAYTPEVPLDESCYREVQNSDIYVLIIGGRYGSETSKSKSSNDKKFYDRYESITKQEYKSAVDKDIPVYILIEKAVYSEYQTFRRNKENDEINYAHVESVNIFYFIEDILAQQRNNPIQTFDRYAEIENWLKEQWAGLFRELIQKASSQKQISSLASQVNELAEMNKTFKRYLEELLSAEDNPDKTRDLISEETQRLNETKILNRLRNNNFIQHLTEMHEIPIEIAFRILQTVSNFKEFFEELSKVTELDKEIIQMAVECPGFELEDENFSDALKIVNLPLSAIDKSKPVNSTRKPRTREK